MKLLERKIDKYLLGWKNNPKRKPLIVKGARQIGKTESIRAFGKANYESVIEINFVLQKKFRAIFDDGYEVETIIKKNQGGNAGNELARQIEQVTEEEVMQDLSDYSMLDKIGRAHV